MIDYNGFDDYGEIDEYCKSVIKMRDNEESESEEDYNEDKESVRLERALIVDEDFEDIYCEAIEIVDDSRTEKEVRYNNSSVNFCNKKCIDFNLSLIHISEPTRPY